jgi:hypothetical protein
MSRTLIVTERDGCRIREVPPPEGWEVVDTYHPHSCPWDYYGNRHVREVLYVFTAAGIEATDCPIHQNRLHPQGTGPGGRVRMGDDWLPGVYRVAVPAAQVEEARAAWAAHRLQVEAWVDGNGPMPEACK